MANVLITDEEVERQAAVLADIRCAVPPGGSPISRNVRELLYMNAVIELKSWQIEENQRFVRNRVAEQLAADQVKRAHEGPGF